MSIIKQDFGEINEAWDFPDISDGTDLTIYSSRFNKGTDGYARWKDIGTKRYIEFKGSFNFTATTTCNRLFNTQFNTSAGKPRKMKLIETNQNNNYCGIGWNVDGNYIGISVNNTTSNVTATVDCQCIIDMS